MGQGSFTIAGLAPTASSPPIPWVIMTVVMGCPPNRELYH
jgi:hypothetical protein